MSSIYCYNYEQINYSNNGLIAGFDEAGRGAIAGPLVVAAVILPIGYYSMLIKDSKLLTANQRDLAYQTIIENAIDYAIVVVEQKIIEIYNPKQAAIIGMEQAFQQLETIPNVCLIDYEKPLFVNFTGKTESIIKGDQKAINIAAASILAKVTRDQIMCDYHKIYPQYRFDIHKGYCTALHKSLLQQYGVSIIHRHNFAPIKHLITKINK